jgi:CTP-dependent riboflavin kinase
MQGLKLAGRVSTGRGEGAKFTELGWARQQFVRRLGIDPFPGTLNLILESQGELQKWAGLRSSPGIQINPPDEAWCIARCYPVTILDQVSGAIVYPEVPGYPAELVEVIAALSLRERLHLADGALLQLEITQPPV